MSYLSRGLIAASVGVVLLANASSQIVISQIYGGGGNSGALYRNDFVELLNIGDNSVDLAGWSIQYASATGATWQVTGLGGTIPPKHYYLVQEAQGSGGTADLPTPDTSGIIAMAASNGKVALVRAVGALSGSCPTSLDIEDLVGYGTAGCFEGSGPAPAAGNTIAVLRLNGGLTDTQNNQADFITGSPEPRNGETPPLPIQLTSLSATLVSSTVVLEWTTDSEVNNLGFYVQRSIQMGGGFDDLPGVFIPGNGTTSMPHTYSWIDSTPMHDRLLYRLRQIDLDGSEHFSPEVFVDASSLFVPAHARREEEVLRVWPNPCNPGATIRFTLRSRSHVDVSIHDVLGREVRQLFSGVAESGAHSLTRFAEGLPSGAYFCRLRTERGSTVRRLVVIR